MSTKMSKYVLVAHMGHDAPWLQTKTRNEVRDRRANIKADKPRREVPLRLKLLKIVMEPLPPRLQKTDAVWQKAYAAWQKTDAAWQKTYAEGHKSDAEGHKSDAEWRKAYAELRKADAEWGKAINSRKGVAFHKKVCGCAWTPEQPDILRQL